MKVMIQEIEELEVTDPKGLCNPPVQQGIPITQQPNIGVLPNTPPFTTPWPTTPAPWPTTPGINPVSPAVGPGIYTRHIHDPNDPLAPRVKWGVGGDAIQQAGQDLDKEKWEQNWQSKMPEKS